LEQDAFAVAFKDPQNDKASPEDIMKRAYCRVFLIISLLGQPKKVDVVAKFLMVSPACRRLYRLSSMGHYRSLSKPL
jgi:hypothetical protein